ncbi:MAG: Single-stranded DNA-binding protein [Mucilaginibacter sp.]|nr:Single-stranded DNA-binding protein [Mucilaginibacter sp.]
MNNLSNCVRLTGRLGAAPELKMTDGEKKWAKISLATNYYKKNAKGETVQENPLAPAGFVEPAGGDRGEVFG